MALAAAPPPGPEGPALRPFDGAETPALSGADPTGKRFDLRELRGRVVLVQFWASWCEPCRDELPALVRLRARWKGRPLEVVTVNLGEGAARAESFLREIGVDLPVVLDRDRRLGAAWGVGGLPMAFVVDAGGRARHAVFGERDWTAGEPAAVLERMVREAERAPGPPRGP